MKSSQSDSGTSAASCRKALKPFDLFTWAGVTCLFHLTPLEASPAAIGSASVLADALEARVRRLERHRRRRVHIRGGASAVDLEPALRQELVAAGILTRRLPIPEEPGVVQEPVDELVGVDDE